MLIISRYAIASADAINSDWLSQWILSIFNPPTELMSFNQSHKNFARVIMSAPPTPVPNLMQNHPRELVGKWVKYNQNFY